MMNQIISLFCFFNQEEGLTIMDDVHKKTADLQSYWNECSKNIDSYQPANYHLRRQWKDFVQAPKHITSWDTGK